MMEMLLVSEKAIQTEREMVSTMELLWVMMMDISLVVEKDTLMD